MNITISTVFLFFPDFPHNPYNGVVCNDTITATGVFGSKELWDLAKGERKGTSKSGQQLQGFLFPWFFSSFDRSNPSSSPRSSALFRNVSQLGEIHQSSDKAHYLFLQQSKLGDFVYCRPPSAGFRVR